MPTEDHFDVKLDRIMRECSACALDDADDRARLESAIRREFGPKVDKRKPIVEELKSGARAQGSQVRPDDLGRRLDYTGDFGLVIKADIGRRIWLKPYGLVMD